MPTAVEITTAFSTAAPENGSRQRIYDLLDLRHRVFFMRLLKARIVCIFVPGGHEIIIDRHRDDRAGRKEIPVVQFDVGFRMKAELVVVAVLGLHIDDPNRKEAGMGIAEPFFHGKDRCRGQIDLPNTEDLHEKCLYAIAVRARHLRRCTCCGRGS